MNYLRDRRAFVCDVFCTLCIYLLGKNSFLYLFPLLSTVFVARHYQFKDIVLHHAEAEEEAFN
jgi:hypothetical protein